MFFVLTPTPHPLQPNTQYPFSILGEPDFVPYPLDQTNYCDAISLIID